MKFSKQFESEAANIHIFNIHMQPHTKQQAAANSTHIENRTNENMIWKRSAITISSQKPAAQWKSLANGASWLLLLPTRLLYKSQYIVVYVPQRQWKYWWMALQATHTWKHIHKIVKMKNRKKKLVWKIVIRKMCLYEHVFFSLQSDYSTFCAWVHSISWYGVKCCNLMNRCSIKKKKTIKIGKLLNLISFNFRIFESWIAASNNHDITGGPDSINAIIWLSRVLRTNYDIVIQCCTRKNSINNRLAWNKETPRCST